MLKADHEAAMRRFAGGVIIVVVERMLSLET
jgi:hypothetical protein